MACDSSVSTLCAVVVLFRPDETQLDRIDRDLPRPLVVVDNSPEGPLARTFVGETRYVWMGKNRGIGAAHNAGVETAIAEFRATHVLLIDQDSSISNALADELVAEWTRHRSSGRALAAIGPRHIDDQSSHELRSVRQDEQRVALPSSGTVLSVDAYRKVGAFREDLFIDMVDFEWCWRAHSLGFDTVRSSHIKMPHTLGSGVQTFAGLRYSLPNPKRCWYQARNLRVLARIGHVPKSFVVATFARQIARMAFTLLGGRGTDWCRHTLQGYVSSLRSIGPLETTR